jgi:thiol-disulfide isomerase/thioredoxin
VFILQLNKQKYKKMKKINIILLITTFLFISCSRETEVIAPTDGDDDFVAELGKVAPSFTREDINGNEIILKDLKNNVVLIEFWATWCAPCRAKMPEMIELYNDYKDKDFIFLGISLDYQPAPLKAYIAEEGIEWPQILDKNQVISINLYQIPGTPHAVVIDKD